MTEKAMEVSGEEQDMTVSKQMTGYDPIEYTDDVAVDKILEYLDDISLLKCRQVSRRWRQEITCRNALWRKRCLRSILHDGLVHIASTNFFRLYQISRQLLRMMGSLKCFVVEDKDTSPLHRFLHEEIVSKERKLQAETESERNIAHIVGAEIKYQESLCQERFVVCTEEGELMVVDEKEEKVLWRTNRSTTEGAYLFNNTIFAISCTGNLEVYSTDRKDCVEIDARGKLRDVHCLSVEGSGSKWYLSVWLENDQVFLVNHRLRVLPLEIPPPKLSECADVESIGDMIIVSNTLLKDGLIGLCIHRDSTICFLVVTESGKTLQHETWMYSCIHKWPFPLRHDKSYHDMVIEHEGHLEAISFQFKGQGLILKKLWKKAIPARFSAAHDNVIVAGKKFLLTCLDGGLQVYRMDDGTMACELPGFRTGPDVKMILFQEPHDKALDIGEFVCSLASINKGKNRADTLFVFNAQWLDGLSPETTLRNFLVAAMFSKDYPRGKFVSWLPGLWDTFRQKEDKKRDTKRRGTPVIADPGQVCKRPKHVVRTD